MISLRDIFGVTVLSVAASFIGFCVYYDQKRRTDPSYKKKVEARRFLQRESCLINTPDGEITPNENEFLHQYQLGEAKILCGDIDEGVRNLCKAIFICDRPVRLLQAMQCVLPEEVFAKLMLTVEETRQKTSKLSEELDLINKQSPKLDISPLQESDKFFSYSTDVRNCDCFDD